LRTDIIIKSAAIALFLAASAVSAWAAGLTVAVPGWYDPAKIPALQKAIDNWNADHEVQVTAKVLVGKREAIYQKIALGAGRPDFADAALVRNEWLGPLAEAKALVPLPDEVGLRLNDEILPALRSAVRQDIRWWAVPFDADVLLLWYRRDLAEAAGLAPGLDNWNEERFIELAGALSTTSPAFAFPAQRTPHAALNFLPWYFSRGGDLRATADSLSINPQTFAEALHFLQTLVDRHFSPANAAALEPNDVYTGLAGGKFAIAVGGSWQRGMLEKQSPMAEQFGALPIPGAGRRPGASLVGGWSFVVFPNADPETLPFLLTLISSSVQGEKLKENGFLPVTRSMLDDPWFTENIDGPPIRRALETGRALPFHPGLNALLDKVATALAEVFLGKKTPEQVAQDLAAKPSGIPETAPARQTPAKWLLVALVVIIIVFLRIQRARRRRP